MHRAQPGLGSTQVDADASDDEWPGFGFAGDFKLHGGVGACSFRDADDGAVPAQRVVQMAAEAGGFVGIEVNKTVDHEQLRLKGVLAQQLQEAGQRAMKTRLSASDDVT